MKITQLIAVDNKSGRKENRILFDKLYIGDSESFVYEFLNDLNDDFSFGLSSEDIGKIFIGLSINSHASFNTNKNNEIYISYKVEEL